MAWFNLKKMLKKHIFYLHNKKTFVNVIKNVTIFLLALVVGLID